jgi:beta-glucosidase
MPTTKAALLDMEGEAIVLLENHNGTLPPKKTPGSVALIGPSADRATFG